MTDRIGDLYAKALFNAAKMQPKRLLLLSELRGLETLFFEYPAYIRLLSSPNLSVRQRCSLLGEVLEKQLSPECFNLLRLLIDNERLSLLSEIIQCYSTLIDWQEQVMEAVCITGAPLSQETEQRLRDKLFFLTGKTVRLRVEIDPSVLGGVLLRYEGKELDGTVRGRLHLLRQRLLSAHIG